MEKDLIEEWREMNPTTTAPANDRPETESESAEWDDGPRRFYTASLSGFFARFVSPIDSRSETST